MSKPTDTGVLIARLHDLLRLDPESGRLFWRFTRGKATANAEAGTLNPVDGYRAIRVDYKMLKSHRIVFALVHGRWPEKELDHINRVRDDNRPCNLREASRAENCHNQGRGKANSSGFKGVSWHAQAGKWRAFITIGRKYVALGLFDSVLDAAAAYERAASQHFGQFGCAA